MIPGWKKRYSDILREFKYDGKKDKESVILLDSILERRTEDGAPPCVSPDYFAGSCMGDGDPDASDGYS